MLFPLRARCIRRAEDVHPAANLLIERIAHADDDFVIAVPVQITAPEAVAPFELGVDHMPRISAGGFQVDEDLIAMPWLNGGNEIAAVFQPALFDFAAASAGAWMFLISF